MQRRHYKRRPFGPWRDTGDRKELLPGADKPYPDDPPHLAPPAPHPVLRWIGWFVLIVIGLAALKAVVG